METRVAFLSLLTLCCLMLATPPAMADTLYSNGLYNGTTDAFVINFGFQVADSFTVPANSSVQGLHFVYWDDTRTDVVTTVDMALGANPLPESGYQTLTGVTNTFLGINQYGYSLFQADFSFATIGWSGDGWITLQNACTTSGCSVVTPIYWDENNGPSMAVETILGSIPSEAFTLTGGETTTGSTPEPGTIMLFGSGILGLAGTLRCKLSR